MPERYAIVGSGGSRLDDVGFGERARGAVEEFSRHRLDEGRWQAFARALSYVSAPLDDPDAFAPLRERLVALDAELGAQGPTAFYCATPPSAFPTIVRRIGEARPGENTRDRAREADRSRPDACAELSRIVREVFDEPRGFRIDHYASQSAGCSKAQAARACRHTTWRSVSSRTRASRWSSGPRSPVRGWRSTPSRWTFPTGARSGPGRRKPMSASCTTRWRAIRRSSCARTRSSGHGRSWLPCLKQPGLCIPPQRGHGPQAPRTS